MVLGLLMCFFHRMLMSQLCFQAGPADAQKEDESSSDDDVPLVCVVGTV